MLKRQQDQLLLYLIPVAVGLGGILYSQLLETLPLRVFVLCLSLSIPLFSGGYLLARFQATRSKRQILTASTVLLVVGASVSITGISEAYYFKSFLSEELAMAAKVAGLLGLPLGIFTVLFTVLWTGGNIEELGAQFRQLMRQMNEGLILHRMNGEVVMVNDHLLEMLDTTRDDILGQNVLEISRALKSPGLEEQIRKSRPGLAMEFEMQLHVRGELQHLWVSSTPLYDRQNRQTGILSTVRNTTEHHQLTARVERYAERLRGVVERKEKELARSEEQYRNLLQSMSEGFLSLDSRHHICYANDRIGEMLGRSPTSLVGKNVLDYVDGMSRIQLFSLLSRMEDVERRSERGELSLLAHEGKPVPVQVAAARMDTSEDSEALYSLVITSLATQKEMQRQLEMRARELETVNEELRMHGRAKDGFLSNVSHELRTPLSTIQGYVEMLETGALGPLESPQEAAFKVMHRNLGRLMGLITEMIEFSRMEIRGIVLNHNLFPPGKLLRESAAAIHPHTMARDVSVNVFVEEELPWVWGDYAKLFQLLGILCDNAVKFTDEGGLIRISAEKGAENSLILTVSDTGIGIEPALHEQIFTKFFQADASKTRRYEGAGIGLSVAKGIAEAHQGRIEVESEAGKGALFRILLPGVLFQAPEELVLDEKLRALRMLAIDDSGELDAALVRVLSEAGCSVHAVADIHACIRHAEQEEPDIILLNDTKPDLEEMAAIDSLRQHPATENTQIVVLAPRKSSRLMEARDTWRDMALLEKPFTIAMLLSTIRQLCLGESPPDTLEIAREAPPQSRQERVLVIDGDPTFLEWVDALLAQRHIACFCAGSTHQAIQDIGEQPPTIILVDGDIREGHIQNRLSLLRQSPGLQDARTYIMAGDAVVPDKWEGIDGVLKKPFTAQDLDKILYARV